MAIRRASAAAADGKARRAPGGKRRATRSVVASTHAEMRRFRRAMENSADMIVLIDRETLRYIDVNSTMCKLLGYSKRELLRMGPADVILESREELIHSYDALIADPSSSNSRKSRYRRKDGSQFPFESRRQIFRSGKRWIIAAISRDITDQANAEQALRESEERFRSLTELSSDWYWEQDADLRFVATTGPTEARGGISPESHIGKQRWELPNTEIIGQTWEEHRALLDARQPFYDLLLKRSDAGNEFRYVSVSGRPIFDSQQQFRGYRGIAKDVTQRVRAEDALRESEARFRSLTHLSSDWYWEQDAQFRFTVIAGPGAAAMASAGDPQVYLGRTRWETPDLAPLNGNWSAHRAQLERYEPFRDLVLCRHMKDGTLRYISVSGEPVFDPDGRFKGYRGVARNVTRRIQSDQLLRLEHQIARALSEAEDATAGIRAVLRAICESQEWVCGRHFALDEAAGLLRFKDAWCIADPAIEQFAHYSRELTFLPGQGLSGAVLQTGEAVWSTDAGNDPRIKIQHFKQLLAEAGIRGAFAFPIVSEGERIGVLTFSSRSLREPDERLLEAVRAIGSQVGQFLQRKRAEDALRDSEARFRSLTQMSSDFFWETDARGRFTQVVHGPNYVSQFGGVIVGKTAWELPSTTPDEAGWARLRATVEAHEPIRDFEFGRPRADGAVRYFSVSGEPRVAADGAFLGYRGVGRDITEEVLSREHIASLAYSDPLTGLSNRTSLGPALDQAVERARRRGSRLATLFIDLDGFKQMNDAYGHPSGDRFLIETARRLRASLRASDLVARLGGDEFFVVLEDVPDASLVETVARKMLAEIMRPFELAPGDEMRVSASIGIAIFPDHAADAPALVKNADNAMYKAKQAGKNAFRFFVPSAPSYDLSASSVA
jgi:diguanylate cyclase (GGDEF)-like protein/PAS domain S-box-containing protein